MSEELNPCPFCRNKAEHYSFTWQKHTVRCRYCLADCGEHDTPERAAFVWNTRPTEDSLKVEVKRLREALFDIATIGLKGKIGDKIVSETMRRIANSDTPEKGGDDE